MTEGHDLKGDTLLDRKWSIPKRRFACYCGQPV